MQQSSQECGRYSQEVWAQLSAPPAEGPPIPKVAESCWTRAARRACLIGKSWPAHRALLCPRPFLLLYNANE